MSVNDKQFHLLAKPAGAACNLGCQYCFFLSKENLYAGQSHMMSDATLEDYVRQLMQATPGPEVHIAWQGGEPMLRGLDFFRRSIVLAEKYRRPGQTIRHTIQTNGTLIDDEWAAFFKAHGYLVGLSLDGPRALHDAYRITKGNEGSFDTVIRGWNHLRAHGVDTNILSTIHAANVDQPLEIGECPRNRFIRTPDGEPGLNYLWAGYKAFFTHIDKPMRTMADLIRQGRYADEIVKSSGGRLSPMS